MIWLYYTTPWENFAFFLPFSYKNEKLREFSFDELLARSKYTDTKENTDFIHLIVLYIICQGLAKLINGLVFLLIALRGGQ